MTDMVQNNIGAAEYTDMAAWLDNWARSERGCYGELSVYHSVLSSFVTAGSTEFPDLEAKPVVLDHLLCQGNDALLAIFEDDAAKRQLDTCRALGLPCVTPYDEEPGQGYWERCLGYFQKHIWKQDRASPPRYAARPLAQGQEGGHAGERMVRDALHRAKMLLYPAGSGYISTYGLEMGVCLGMLPGHSEAVYVCAEATWDRVSQSLPGTSQPPAEEVLLPLDARLDRASRGEKAPKIMRQIIEDFAAMPLGRWMEGYPNELQKLAEAGLWEETTYREAAEAIYKMLWNDSEEEQGLSLLMALTTPHVKGMKR